MTAQVGVGSQERSGTVRESEMASGAGRRATGDEPMGGRDDERPQLSREKLSEPLLRGEPDAV